MSADDLKEIISPAAKRALADEVTDRIREVILSGRLEPGARLREEVLATSLNVSRGPVREALRKLEREGLVLVYPNRGAFIARLSRKDLEEVYSLRLIIERLAVQRMILRADPAPLDELQAVVDTLNTFSARGITAQEAAKFDLRFHDIIFRASHHGRLYHTWATMQSQIHILLLTRHVAADGFGETIVKRHQELLDAIRTGDESIALATLESHLRESYEHVSKTYMNSLDAASAADSPKSKTP